VAVHGGVGVRVGKVTVRFTPAGITVRKS
jgi:hypothetical protein